MRSKGFDVPYGMLPGKLLYMRGNGAGERKMTAPKETRVEEEDEEKKKAMC